MPKPAANIVNMTKHLTKEQIQARTAQEEALERKQPVCLSPPSWLTQDPAAFTYWNDTIDKMKDIALLDDVDADMLAVYCQMLSRRDALSQSYGQYLSVPILDKLQAQERIIIQYAEKLGLTPSGRARLARKRASEGTEDPDGDLFGDG